ncbi:MAG: VanZ family protein [Pleurocapsa sp.]
MKVKKGLLFILMSFSSFLGVIIFMRNNNLGNSFFNLFVNIPHYDKIGHFTLMGILAFLAVISITPLLPYSTSKSSLLVLVGVLFLIAIEECSQIFVVTRTFSLADFFCDFLGVTIFGLMGYSLVDKGQQNKM